MLTRDYLNQNAASVVAEILAEGRTAGIEEGRAAGRAEGRTEGATAERERIQAVEAQALAGHGELVTRLKFDGITSGPEAAVQILAAERAKGGQNLAHLRDLAPKPAPAASSPTGDVAAESEAADAALPLAERAKAQFDRDPKIRAEFETVERYTGWLKHEEKRKAA